MGGLSGMMGTAGGTAGSGVSIMNPVDQGQVNTAYQQTQQGLTQQNQFLQALQAQNGVGNQSSVFNQLQGTANGTGANPAQAQLAQATGQNVAAQTAMMAGQRGSSSNVGLMARQAATQGANTQQQAVGQAATMQANQSLNALNSMGSLATNQVGQQANATNAYSSAAQGQQQNLIGGVASANTANSAIIQNSLKAQAGLVSGGGAGLVSAAQGGMIPKKMADGGQAGAAQPDGPVTTPPPQAAAPSSVQVTAANDPSSASGPRSAFGKAINGMANTNQQSAGMDPAYAGGQSLGNGIAKTGKAIYKYFSSSSPSTSKSGTASPQNGGAQNPTVAGQDSPDAAGNQNFGVSQQGVDLSNSANGTTPGATPSAGPDATATDATDASDATDAASDASSVADAADAASDVSDVADAASGIADVAEVAVARGGIIKKRKKFADGGEADDSSGSGMGTTIVKMIPAIAAMMANGGKVPALVSPGEQYLTPQDVKKVVTQGKNPLAVGERIPGKPKVAGNSYANDTVHKKLDSGGIVIPNSIMQSSDPAGNAAKFIAATLKNTALKHGKKK